MATPAGSAVSATPTCRQIADRAVAALHDEVDLTPKPGLVDRRGPGAHTDMTAGMLHASADALHAAFYECASAAAELPFGDDLRRRIGVIGRIGEQTMLTATGGINTHRGALWALGLVCAAAGSGALTAADLLTTAGRLARLPDPAVTTSDTPGARARTRYRVSGAPGEAQAGFPHIALYALPILHPSADPVTARLDALLTLISHLEDTCILHRGGTAGLHAVRDAARRVLHAGGMRTTEGRQAFTALDHLCRTRRLSPGGSGDLLAATMLVADLDRGRTPPCKP